jgi:hypothetical protein
MSGEEGRQKRRFRHHYSVVEAEALIPLVTGWLMEIRILRQTLQRQDERLLELLHDHGDQGGSRVNDWIRNLDRMRSLADEFSSRELQIEDVEQGLVGFPAIRAGREVLLSWQEGDDRIEFWKEPDAGQAGREPLG